MISANQGLKTMNAQTAAIVDLGTIKSRQQAAWNSSDYAVVITKIA